MAYTQIEMQRASLLVAEVFTQYLFGDNEEKKGLHGMNYCQEFIWYFSKDERQLFHIRIPFTRRFTVTAP